MRGYSRAQATALVEEIARQRKAAYDQARAAPEKAEPKEKSVKDVLGEWRAIFQARVRKGYCKESTLRERRREVNTYCELLGAETSFLALDYSRIEYVFTEQPTRGSPHTLRRTKKDVSGSTLYGHAQQLRRIFRWAVKRGYARANPLVALMEEPFVEDWKQDIRDGREKGDALTTTSAGRFSRSAARDRRRPRSRPAATRVAASETSTSRASRSSKS